MVKDPQVFISHILDCIEKIQIYTKGLNKAKFLRSVKTQDAIIRNMKPNAVILFLLAVIMPAFLFAEEKITITTYYPSPYGSYNELTSNQLTTTGNTYLATTTGGKVGIGTTSTAAKLEVRGAPIKFANANDRAHTWFPYTDGNVYISGDDQTGQGDIIFRADNGTAYSEFMRIIGSETNKGNVGIGTTNPSDRLHVSGGDIRLDNGYELFFADNGQIRSMDNNHRILFRRSENKMEFREFGDLIFSPGATSGAETAKVVMQAGGNVGIGTTSPTNILSLGNTAAQKFWIENSATDVAGRALTVAAGGTITGTSVNDVNGGNLILQSGLGTGTGASTISFQTGTPPPLTGKVLQTMSTKMTILGSGNVGIGTTAPSGTGTPPGTLLEVAGSSGTPEIKVKRTGTGDDARITVSHNANNVHLRHLGTLADIRVGGGSNVDLAFRFVGNDETMRITSGGRVGIGTTSPNTRLTVEGTVKGSSVDATNVYATNIQLGEISRNQWDCENGKTPGKTLFSENACTETSRSNASPLGTTQSDKTQSECITICNAYTASDTCDSDPISKYTCTLNVTGTACVKIICSDVWMNWTPSGGGSVKNMNRPVSSLFASLCFFFEPTNAWAAVQKGDCKCYSQTVSCGFSAKTGYLRKCYD